MSETNWNLLCVFLGSYILSLLINKTAIVLSLRKQWFIDKEDKPQKIHTVPTPRLGGLSLILCFVFVSFIFLHQYLLAIILIPTFMGGFLEDLHRDIKPKIRLGFMLVTAVLAIWLLDAVVQDFDFFNVPYALGVFITLVAILGLTNGINIIDGFNGLAGLTNLLIFSNFFMLSMFHLNLSFALISLGLVGALLGFLFFNLPKGLIFLGDGGAYFLGAVAAIMSILMFNKFSPEVSAWYFLLVLIYPVWEVIFSFFRRIIRGRHPLKPDKFHLHTLIYRNLAYHRNSVVVLYILPFLSLFSYLTFYYRSNPHALLILSIVFVSIYTLAYYKLRKMDFVQSKRYKSIEAQLIQKMNLKKVPD